MTVLKVMPCPLHQKMDNVIKSPIRFLNLKRDKEKALVGTIFMIVKLQTSRRFVSSSTAHSLGPAFYSTQHREISFTPHHAASGSSDRISSYHKSRSWSSYWEGSFCFCGKKRI